MGYEANFWLAKVALLILVYPTSLAIRKWLNGRREQEAATEEMLGSLPRVLEESPEGVANFGLRIVEHERLPDGSWRLLARGYYESEVVGFSAVVRGDWKPSSAPGRGMFYVGGTVELSSTGPESDRFVAALRKAYSVESPTGPMAKSVRFTGIALQGNPKRLGGELVQLKLFFESADPERNAECYFNVDVRTLRLQFHEKDEGYREPLIRAFTSAHEKTVTS